jgi:hypothetical protein
MRVNDMSSIIRKKCDKITNKLSANQNRSQMHQKISSELKQTRTKQQLFINQRFSTNVVFVSWANHARSDIEHKKFHRQRKKKNRHLSCCALKTEMKYILRYCAHVNFDSDRDHWEKAFEATWSVEKDQELIVDSDTNRENRLRQFLVQTKDSRSDVDLVSMRLRQLNDQICNHVLRVNEWQRTHTEWRRHYRLSSNDDVKQKVQNNQ